VTSTEDGSPLPGVNVIVKGTTNGTVSDAEGKYSLSIPSSNASLVFSFIGLKGQEVVVGERSVVDVSMSLDVTQLSEIVVTGTGVATEKKKLAIAVESVTADRLPAAPTASIDQALVGKIAGAQISSTSGLPGANINILLRGVNTINRGVAPIILLDGVQMGVTNLNSIDLNSIERVEVVQGAAAATIYGAQGANGVIQLFTKKGKSGQINIDASSSVAINELLNVGDLHKARFHSLKTDADNNVIGASGKPLVFDETTQTYSENVIWASTNPATNNNKPYDKNLKYYDHYKMFLESAYTVNNNVTISGGRDKFDFNISASNNHQTSNFKNNGSIDRSNFTSNIGMELLKGLSLRSITQLVYTKNTINWDQSVLYAINNSRPFANYDGVDPSGNFGYYFGDAVGVNGGNPNYYQQYTTTRDNKVDVVQSFNLNYKFPKFVVLDAKYGINYQKQDQRYIYLNQSTNNNVLANGESSYLSNYNGGDGGEIDQYNLNKTYQNFLATATLSLDFKEDLGLNIPIKSTTQGAFDWRNSKNKEFDTYALNLPLYNPFTSVQALTFKVPGADQRPPYGGDYTEQFVTYGFLVNQSFDFGEVAGISGGFRSDYSSAFGRGSKPFTFPRANGYFRISSLNFWDNSRISDAILEFKVRAAFGKAGIQPKPFDRYVTLGTKTIGSNSTLYFTNGQSNPNLGVEVSQETEFGTDITFNLFKGNYLNNLAFSFTYWDRKTNNAIYDLNAAPSVGTGTVKDNAFGLGSHGIQASLNAALVSTSNFKWNLTTNFGKQTSEITSVTGNAEIVVTSSAGSTNYVLKAGEKIGQLYGYLGLHSVTAKDPSGNFFIPEANQANYEVASNGWVVNKTTKAPYFTRNLYSFGDPNPKFNMSFINDFTYKNFLTFGVQIDWVNGSHLYNQTKEWMYRDGIHGDYDKQITINGETGAWSAFYRGVYAEVSRNGTKNYFYENASFARLRNISVGVDFAKLINVKGLRRLQLVLSGRNIATITKYTGMDPEISSGTNSSAWDRGTDHNTTPNYKSYQASLYLGL
jgi:TonB-linked SusC/RagA family outer membrane protein